MTFCTATIVSCISGLDSVGCTRNIRLTSPSSFETGRRLGGRIRSNAFSR